MSEVKLREWKEGVNRKIRKEELDKALNKLGEDKVNEQRKWDKVVFEGDGADTRKCAWETGFGSDMEKGLSLKEIIANRKWVRSK